MNPFSGLIPSTLQTLSSWIINEKNLNAKVPSIPEIQERILQSDNTKTKQFVGSKEWIGCYEMFLVLDGLFDVPCRLVHCRSGENLREHLDVIIRHLQQSGSPIPIGGDTDCSSKAIFGVRQQASGTSLLVVDPHFVRETEARRRSPRGSSSASRRSSSRAPAAPPP